MSRADLVVNLVETGMKGDILRFKKTAEAIAADAATKRHYQFADRVRSILESCAPIELAGPTRPGAVQSAFYEMYPQKAFSDLVLPDDVESMCVEVIEEHQRRDVLRSYNMEPRHKILLCGTPGNGKTTLAEAFATQMMVPFFVVKYEGIIDKYLGATAQHLDNLFEHVKTQRCVLFLDEFDAIGKERQDANESGEMKRVVNALLKQIDLLPSHVVVIAATNHGMMLDSAMWRRFQLQINLPKPTPELAIIWLTQFEQRIGNQLGIPLQTIADELQHLSFAELEEFALDVQRKYVLGLPNTVGKMKDITCQKVAVWKARFKVE